MKSTWVPTHWKHQLSLDLNAHKRITFTRNFYIKYTMNIHVFLFLLTYYIESGISNSTHNMPELTIGQDLKEMEYKEGTSVEHKYSLPLVNIEVSDKNQTNIVPASLSRMLDFFNTEKLVANWGSTKRMVSNRCKRDVEAYIDGLRRTENWALKMDDASGRYSTGWFWGNHYWTGSQSLCDNIAPEEKIIIVTSKNSTRFSREAEISRKNPSPSQVLGYETGPIKYATIPPFPVAFFMLRVHLNTSFTTEEKIIHIGLCLPHICSDKDVSKIVEGTAKPLKHITVNVEAVRSHHNRFDIFLDKTFLVLCLATCFTVVMLFVGTMYDFYLEHLRKKYKISSKYGSHTKDNITMDMTVPDLKMKNGKCGVYIINSSTNNNNNNIDFYPPSKPAVNRSIKRLVFKELLLSFSLRANIKTICDSTVGSDTIPVIHGLKSISMAWVILGHTCIIAFKYSDNMEYRKVVQREFLFQTVSNGVFSVDTFFFTSGLLVSFLYFRTNAKGKLDPLTHGHKGFIAGLLHFFGLIIYRFARLTAPYLFTLGLVEVTMKWFNYNSVFEPPTLDHENCPNYWWRNILYINTLFPVEEMCMLWSWYLSDDTQFYVIGAIILILSTSHFKSAAAVLLVFMMSSWITTGYIAFSNSHMPGSDDPLALFDKIYDKPWTRLGPYLIGMCIGWFLFKKNCQLQMSKLTIVIGWTLSVGCLLSLIYGLYEVNLSPIVGATYSSLSHSAWALSLAWIVVACSTGNGGAVNTILSSPILYPFSRVTYCAYLLHPIIIRLMMMSMDSPLHLGSLVMIIIFLGQTVASYAISFFVSLAFEAPIVSMLRIMQKIVDAKKAQNRTAPS